MQLLRTLSLIVLASPALAQGSSPEAELPTLAQLLERMRSQEADLEKGLVAGDRTVYMEMETSSSFPDGTSVSTKGVVRVLGKEHFHNSVAVEFGDGMRSENETVRNPNGVWMREKDPVQGELYLRMNPEDMARLEEAAKELGQDGDAGPVPVGRASAPVGSKVLEDLGRQFELKVSRRHQAQDGETYWVIGGTVREGAESEFDVMAFSPDQIDIQVRERDGVLTRMTQLRSGSPVLDVRITRMELDRPMKPESFVMEIPARQEVLDVMEHPPARQQIDRMLSEAEEKRAGK